MFVYFVWPSLVIGCLPCICKAGLRPAFFYNESWFWCLCTSSSHLLSFGACLVFVKLAFGQLSFIMNKFLVLVNFVWASLVPLSCLQFESLSSLLNAWGRAPKPPGLLQRRCAEIQICCNPRLDVQWLIQGVAVGECPHRPHKAQHSHPWYRMKLFSLSLCIYIYINIYIYIYIPTLWNHWSHIRNT